LTRFNIFLIILIVAGSFVGGCVNTENNSSPSNLTLWEKSQTPNKHSMCLEAIQQIGHLSVYSPGNDQIKTIFFTIGSAPGMQIDLMKTNFTISTANYTKTLRYGDIGLSLRGIKKKNVIILDQYEYVDLEFNLSEMGFTDETFGPDQRFIIAIVSPEDGSCNNIFVRRFSTPHHLEPMNNTMLMH
jgi:archaellin